MCVHMQLYLTFQVSNVDLQIREIPEDLLIVLVNLQGVQITLDCLLVVAIGSIDETIHMPCDVTLHVELQSFLRSLVRLLLLLQGVEQETLHAQSFSVVREY